MLQHEPSTTCTASAGCSSLLLPALLLHCDSICHFCPQQAGAARPRPLQSGCCSGGFSPRFTPAPGAAPGPGMSRNRCPEPLGTAARSVPAAPEGRAGKGHCIPAPDTRHGAWPTQSPDGCRGGSPGQAWLSQPLQQQLWVSLSPLPSPAMSFLLRSSHTGLLLQCIREPCQQTWECSWCPLSPSSAA